HALRGHRRRSERALRVGDPTVARIEGGDRVSSTQQPPRPDVCLRCGGQLQSMGVEEFRVGGTTGGWKLLFGEWAEVGEGMLPLEVLACATCHHVELRAPTAESG